jgi:hypothetical protein
LIIITPGNVNVIFYYTRCFGQQIMDRLVREKITGGLARAYRYARQAGHESKRKRASMGAF